VTDQDYLRDAVQKTFPEMAFIDVEPIDESIEISEASHIIEISYEAPELGRGTISLVLPLPCKRAIVENIYGEAWEELESEAIDDCLLEILNVLAGEYLSSRYGPDVKRELSLPRLVFDRDELGKAPKTEYAYFDAEGTPFLVIHGSHPDD
jgi:hypothetical protein